MLGVAYKKDISDVRGSPALDVIELLHRKNAKVTFHDPYVDHLRIDGTIHKSGLLTDQSLRAQNCVVITTNHSCFDIQKIVANSRLVVDSRNATKGIKSEKIVKF